MHAGPRTQESARHAYPGIPGHGHVRQRTMDGRVQHKRGQRRRTMTTAAVPSDTAAIVGCGLLRAFPVIDQVEWIAQPPPAGANVLSRWPGWRCRIDCGRCQLARRTRSMKSTPDRKGAPDSRHWPFAALGTTEALEDAIQCIEST